MSKPTPTAVTPHSLAAFRRDRCWSVQRLADEIYGATGTRLAARTLIRFMERSHRASEPTQLALQKFMNAQRTQEASR